MHSNFDGESTAPDYSSLVDRNQIARYCEILHASADGIKGVLIASAIFPCLDSSGNGRLEHAQFAVSDVEAMVETCANWASVGANVYVTWTVFRADLPTWSRGRSADVIKVLALVADRDADTGKAGERIIDPTIEVISSSQPNLNFNEVYVLQEPLDVEEASTVGRGLRAAMGADSATGDIVRLSRVPGTLNYPDRRKIDRGRPREPQRVALGSAGHHGDTPVEHSVLQAELF